MGSFGALITILKIISKMQYNFKFIELSNPESIQSGINPIQNQSNPESVQSTAAYFQINFLLSHIQDNKKVNQGYAITHKVL